MKAFECKAGGGIASAGTTTYHKDLCVLFKLNIRENRMRRADRPLEGEEMA
jgi:hypothetical protein